MWLKKCPVERTRKLLLDKKVMSEKEMEKLLEKINKEIDEAVEFGKNSPFLMQANCLRMFTKQNTRSEHDFVPRVSVRESCARRH